MADDRKYTAINFEQVIDQLGQIFKAKEGSLADFGSSSYGRTLMEIFGATVDMDAFWIESAFRDSWLATAQNSSSMYAGARSIGYSIRRPVPARAGFQIALSRTGSKPTVKVVIPKNTVFSVSGRTLICIDDVEFISDRNEPDFTGVMTLKSGRAILIEGVIRNQQFFSNGSKFQEFNLADTSFSEWFGSNDPNYVEPDKMEQRLGRFTVISSDSGLTDISETVPGYEDKIFWRVSRRGLHDPYLENNSRTSQLSTESSNKSNNFSVLVETANDGSVTLRFGDGVISAIPFGIINVQYLSTQGEGGNLLNVAGSRLSTQSNDIIITQINGQESDLTLDDLIISITTDIRGGLDVESIESIRNSASKVYSNLDSLNNKNSYVLFLMRQFDIKYANAFGEDIISKLKFNKFNIKYSNVVRYTLLKDLYRRKDGIYYVTDPYEYSVDGYKINGLMYTWNYDYSALPTDSDVQKLNLDIETLKENIDNGNIAIIQLEEGKTLEETSYDDIIANQISSEEFIQRFVPINLDSGLVPGSIFNAHIRPGDFLVEGSELQSINDSLNRRAYLSLNGNHVYVPPTVHDMGMKIDLILLEGTNFSDIKNKVIQAIYAHLKEQTSFASPIYRSKIESLIQNMPEVAGVNLKFEPRVNQYTGLKIDELLWLGSTTSQYIRHDTTILNPNDIEISFIFDYDRLNRSGDVIDSQPNSTETINLTNLVENVQKNIKEYYIANLSKKDTETGTYIPRTNVTEEMLNQFTSYIWSIVMNEIYTSLNEKYIAAKERGSFIESDKLFNLIESLRGWDTTSGALTFKDTNSIKNLTESGTSMYQYMVYTLEYIKIVRNIFATITSNMLIDTNGNITKYSNENEVVQFSISTSDITLNLGRK